jgi:hypothetical protein
MTKAELKLLTVEQKALEVYNAMHNPKGKKFDSVEEACKHYKLAPASYYIYAKKFRGLVDLTKELPQKPITASNWIEEIQALRKQREEIKQRFEAELKRIDSRILTIVSGEVRA